MDLVEKLRPKRKDLVKAAENVASKMFESGGIIGRDGKLTFAKSQLNHLIAVCGEATCVEEIENYIRYQAARGSTGWTLPLSSLVISEAGKVMATIDGDDLLRVTAFRLYTTFLTRAFTYEVARRESTPVAAAGGNADAARGGFKDRGGKR